jgi:hypothetical protein
MTATAGGGWARYAADGYEVSSRGDRRFSALFARLSDGRTIEEAYQLDVKGYRQTGGTSWRVGKGKPPVVSISKEDLWLAYLGLWQRWFRENPEMLSILRADSAGRRLTDRFAKTPINQAHALAVILSERPSAY